MDGFVLFLGDWIPGCGCGNVDSGRGSAGECHLALDYSWHYSLGL